MVTGQNASGEGERKIVHVDLDCFYAAIEERDHPELRGKPLAVGGRSRRGVLTTANYPARKYGCRSAMPVFKALELCPELVLMPVRSEVYRAESARIRRIFRRFTRKIEPLSLDEAYLDLSHWRLSGAHLAQEIRAEIQRETGLSASAGIGPNKLIAKIASDWNKPNGQFEVKAEEAAKFMADLPVDKLWGVGKKSAAKLEQLGFHFCRDLLPLDKFEMAERFGRFGVELFDQIRGVDHREVTPDRIRKSISCERTFRNNVNRLDLLEARLAHLLDELRDDYQGKHIERSIKALVIKIKFSDFSRTTAERGYGAIDEGIYRDLLRESFSRGEGKPVRLLGVGLRFEVPQNEAQLEFL